MKKFFSLIAAVLFAGSMMAAVGNLYYTATFLKGTGTEAISGYAESGTYTWAGMAWTIPGNNTNGDYIRIGGKKITSVGRVIASQAGFDGAIAKIVIAHNGKSRNDVVVDSVVLTVASDAAFSADVERKVVVAPTVAKSAAGTVEFLADESWALGRYYKFSFFITNTSSSNGGLDVQSIAFYSYQDPNAPAINAENVNFGLVPTMVLPVEKNANLVVTGANLSSAIAYSVLGSNVTVAGELTAEGGTLAVTLNAAAEGEISDTIVLTSGAAVTKVAVEATVLETVGDGSKENPFSVADVVKLNNGIGNDKYWVMGYIVGSAANGGVIAGTPAATNLAIGDAADQTEGVAPVELPSGDIRAALNIVDNEENVGKLVKVHGQLLSYFLFTGVKAVDEFEFVSDPTAISNTAVEGKAVKFFENGQLIIMKNGVKYNAQGAVVR